jgi:hypothetical protein
VKTRVWIAAGVIIAAAVGGSALAFRGSGSNAPTESSASPGSRAAASSTSAPPDSTAANGSSTPTETKDPNPPLQTANAGACLGTNNDCTQTEREAAATATTVPDLFAGQPIVDLTPTEAIAKVRSSSLEFPSLTRIEAKQCTFLEYVKAKPDASMPGVSAGRAVIVVAAAGTVVPEFAGALTYPWGVIAYDVRTGMPLGMHATYEGRWPPFWHDLPGRVTVG